MNDMTPIRDERPQGSRAEAYQAYRARGGKEITVLGVDPAKEVVNDPEATKIAEDTVSYFTGGRGDGSEFQR